MFQDIFLGVRRCQGEVVLYKKRRLRLAQPILPHRAPADVGDNVVVHPVAQGTYFGFGHVARLERGRDRVNP